MARAKTLRRNPSSARGRSFSSVPMGQPRRPADSSRPLLGSATRLFFTTSVIAAPFVAFILSGTVRDWTLEALGYGLIPVSSWAACFAVAIQYRRSWLRRFWRVWLGSALLVAASLSVLSMIYASGGVMADASLGGDWGQYLGGLPLAIGTLKIAGIALISPPLLFPREALRVYRLVAVKLAKGSGISSKWLVTHLWRWARISAGRVVSRPSREKTPVPGPLSAEVGEGPTTLSGPVEERKLVASSKVRGARGKGSGWQLPSLDLLQVGENRPVPQAALQQMAQHIESTLAEHRLEVAVEDIRTGPRVIRFGLVPGWMKKYRESKGGKSKSSDVPPMEMSRVKVQSILMREKDLALALKTPYLRLEAPVPGESLVGLEMPSPYPRKVVLRSVVESPSFRQITSKGGLPVALGEDTGGEPIVADLSDLPHLLIAGATGSGKSVCINATIASLLLTNGPDRLRLLMVDPKRVELTPFNGIPHLIAPVIVDTDEVLLILRAVQNEMLRRYKAMEEIGVRNIEGYNKKAGDRIPFLVVVIDELADLMMAAAYEVEQALVRLAQLGRATGIHLVLATQRPSVNVVTGLLKANVPSRVAFAVASQVDSRVILDSVGAEKLLGKGDMLLITPDSAKPKRVQGTYVDDSEIEKLVEFWQVQSGPPVPPVPLDEHRDSASGEQDDDDPDDHLLQAARELAERSVRISPSVLQRRLKIGYQRAVGLMELLEEEGLTAGPPELAGVRGSRPGDPGWSDQF